MARVAYAPRVTTDLDWFLEFEQAEEALEAIFGAIGVLARHPRIGRPAGVALRELVITHGAEGFVALYRYNPVEDTVTVLAIRHQREAGFEEL